MSLFLKKSPKISIVVIIYNKEKYIEECLDSIISQNIDKEVICVDDCSTDNTSNILNKYAKKYKEIKIIRNEENLGTCLTRYNGLKKCNGDYVLFVDGDDRLIDNSLEKIYEEALTNNADILEFSALTNGDEKVKKYLKLKKNCIDNNLLEAHNKVIITNQIWNKLISKKVYKKAFKLMNNDLRQDDFSDVLYFVFHFLNNADNVYQTSTLGYYYYKDRGMTALSTYVENLKHYCNFGITYNELCYIYGETKELFYYKNVVCNQAIEAYLKLDLKEQTKYYKELKKLMTDEEIKFLINEKKKGI